MANGKTKRKRTMTAQQKRDARASARKHGRSSPGLWENVNASKGKGAKSKRKSRPKGRTRPGKRSRRPRKRR